MTAFAPAVHADDPEAFDGIALHPTDPNVFALHYSNAIGGLVFSRDGGRSAQLLPGRAIHYYGLTGRVPMVFAGDGRLLLALGEGLDVDDGRGCFPRGTSDVHQFSEPAVRGVEVTSVVAHPSDPDISFLVTQVREAAGHAGLWRRDKQGTLTPLGKSEPPVASLAQAPFVFKDLAVVTRTASVDGIRFLQTGVAYDFGTTPPMMRAVLRVSDDLGGSWATHAVTPLSSDVGNPRILYVDGSEAFGALIRIDNTGKDEPPDAIFATRDGAQSFQPYLDQLRIAHAVLRLPSGQLLIADGGPSGGLWSAANLDMAPTQIGSEPIQCLAYLPSSQKIVMCRRHEVGYYDVASNTFCAMFRMGELSSLVACSAEPLRQNTLVMSQLCEKYCGPLHFATSPLCTALPVPSGALCGPAAVAWETQDPDPEKRYTTLPGNNAAPRCAGFSAPPDAGVGVAPDGGVGQGSDAAVGADAGDAAAARDGEIESGDAAVVQAPNEQDAEIDPGDGAPMRRGDGCGCRVAGGAPDTGSFAAWLAGALSALLALRLRRRAARRP